MSSLYNSLRLAENQELTRVEVNQRALIDKILARYASENAIFRELLQNSNDADATEAVIEFTTNEQNLITQAVYKNNGMVFRQQDWSRLQKIAEGNPSPSKVGAFGVGAYTMFSICEEPVVVSGDSSCCFVWKGDALWCKTAKLPEGEYHKWTTFILPSRDLYPLPVWKDFCSFLKASLTFTASLKHVRVMLNEKEYLSITKTLVQEPRLIQIPKSKGTWWTTLNNASNNNNEGVTTSTPKGVFSLMSPKSSTISALLTVSSKAGTASQIPAIYESVQRISVILDNSVTFQDARYVSALAHTNIPADMAKRMHRVTKKEPPKTVKLELFFAPDGGKIFIGFRTSQSTGLSVHVSAPFIPTVEREAMDLQDAALRVYNMELLEMAGILLRLTLEQAMYVLREDWSAGAESRQILEQKLLKERELSKEKRKLVPRDTKEKSKEDSAEGDEEATSAKSGLVGFARFMARGVKKKIVQVVGTLEEMVDVDNDLLNPNDLRPLDAIEEQVIELMQSFCPVPSTPDPLVGTCLAQGFARCLPNVAPPVLTRTSVVPADQARLPNAGMQAFCDSDQVIRQVVYDNAADYHNVIAQCHKLNFQDMLLSLQQKVLSETELIQLLQWIIQYQQRFGIELLMTHRLKDAISFRLDDSDMVMRLSDLLFTVEKDSVLSKHESMPLPDTVFPVRLQEQVKHLNRLPWFQALDDDLWVSFIAEHSAMTMRNKNDHAIRLEMLQVICEMYQKKRSQKEAFGRLCACSLSEKPCLPVEGQDGPERPVDLYLDSDNLKLFEQLGTFNKVSSALNVTEDFLLTIGVRRMVSIDFLLTHLDTLKWSQNPRPLIEYLRKASLTSTDFQKLKSTQYLPSKGSNDFFAPSELYLPNGHLDCFSFCKQLKWETNELSEQSDAGLFLRQLGMKSLPPLNDVLQYMTQPALMPTLRKQCLEFLADRLAPRAHYHAEYSKLMQRQHTYKFLPCTVVDPLQQSTSPSNGFMLLSPSSCYTEKECAVLGFPILQAPDRQLYGNLFCCRPQPSSDEVLRQFNLVLERCKKSTIPDQTIAVLFEKQLFPYLSHANIEPYHLTPFQAVKFIPLVSTDGKLQWYRPDQVFFQSTENIFPVVPYYSPFLASAGVQQEVSTKEIFLKMLDQPSQLLEQLGPTQYRVLLRRIAAHPPFDWRTNPRRWNEVAFLLTDGEPPLLSKASDIYVMDNSFLGRMFPMINKAPHETDLEALYTQLGSLPLSQSVQRRFEYAGHTQTKTSTCTLLNERCQERSPLLLSVMTRPLVSNAALLLQQMQFQEAQHLLAVYSLEGMTKRQATTAFLSTSTAGNTIIYVTTPFDWFDVGNAVGDLILKGRCRLEDAFFLSSLLEAPIEQLRSRGFPVDRIITTIPPETTSVKAKSVNGEPTGSSKANGTTNSSASVQSNEVPQQSTASASSTGQTEIKSESSQAETNKAPSTSEPSNSSTQPDTTSTSTEALGTISTQPPRDDTLSQIVMDMFPDADPNFVKSALGTNPSLEDVQNLANQMSQGGYPKDGEENTSSSSSDKSKKGLRGRLSRALGGGRKGTKANPPSPIDTPPTVPAPVLPSFKPPAVVPPVTDRGSSLPPQAKHVHENANPVPPVHDSSNHQGLERLLQQTVRQSNQVSPQGIDTAPTTLTSSLPEGLDRGDTCDVIPGQRLRAFGTTRNGLRVFSWKDLATSSHFLEQNQNVVNQFSIVLERLAGVYDLPLKSMAIFHDPMGQIIAFNSNRSLHFNIRFFHSLHASQPFSVACYSYWYVTIAHELAHHLVSAHNKEHGFYTESYTSLYLPKLTDLLKEL